MIEVRETPTYASWFAKLADQTAKAQIDIRVRRLSLGNFGDAKPVGNGVAELKIDCGPGYRVYFLRRGSTVVILLAGGDKRTQARDIALAKKDRTGLEMKCPPKRRFGIHRNIWIATPRSRPIWRQLSKTATPS